MSGDGVDFFPTTYAQSADAMAGRSPLVDSMDASTYATSFDDEPPLLDELGIYPEHIWRRTKTVLNPISKAMDESFLEDRDVAGPLVFCFLLGLALLLTGKLYMGYIYGIGFVGSLGIYVLITVMTEHSLDMYQVVSVLGYAMLPVVVLAFLSIVVDLHGYFGAVLGIAVIAWCTRTASSIFASTLGMQQQRYLIAYPIFMFYGAFVIFATFQA